ncbi:PstS family phosphate ABC transporter substrate-binding protein [Dictyobacter kobayashii]|uniref:Phosphate-binding protein n=1 Tax=Dictyobacter kobayashii TaxID=2014872 RepID=A0A402AGG9_9CHLR|nr:phosphate ABC transporter substrate-binding protein [Dictyobacter kobayashii]GCE18175.1 phosphate-binding protein [Dictyobacter kobayashii]
MQPNVHANLRKKRARMLPQSVVMGILPVFVLLFAASLLTGCAGTDQQTQQFSGQLKISGSTALQPLVAAAAKEFMRQHPEAHITVAGGGSKTGLLKVFQKQSDIGDSDLYADPAIYPDPNMTDHIICATPFVMIVHPDINITSLTKEQILDIFSTGKTTNWSQIKAGLNQPIHPIIRPSSSGTRETFRKYILGGGDEIGTPLKVDDTQQVVNTVANTPGAIGYIALSALKPTVKAIAIDNASPTAETISNGTYNFWSYEHMYTLGDNNSLLSAFLDFMISPAMQQEAHQLSYITIDEMNVKKIASIPAKPLHSDTLAISPFTEKESEIIRSESYE